MTKHMAQKSKNNSYVVTHKIKIGEDLQMISHAYKTNIERILKLNQNTKFYVGQFIKVPNNK